MRTFAPASDPLIRLRQLNDNLDGAKGLMTCLAALTHVTRDGRTDTWNCRSTHRSCVVLRGKNCCFQCLLLLT